MPEEVPSGPAARAKRAARLHRLKQLNRAIDAFQKSLPRLNARYTRENSTQSSSVYFDFYDYRRQVAEVRFATHPPQGYCTTMADSLHYRFISIGDFDGAELGTEEWYKVYQILGESYGNELEIKKMTARLYAEEACKHIPVNSSVLEVIANRRAKRLKKDADYKEAQRKRALKREKKREKLQSKALNTKEKS